jgi:hypothetical protein
MLMIEQQTENPYVPVLSTVLALVKLGLNPLPLSLVKLTSWLFRDYGCSVSVILS